MKKSEFMKNIKEKTISHEEFTRNFSQEDKKKIAERIHYYEMLMVLRELRGKLGYTQAELAEKASLPRTTLTKIESGTHNPTIATLNQIARALNKKLVIRFE
jgi:DNA-binding XRE family transcriptional regulator